MKCGIVILNYNSYQDTKDCIRSIREKTKGVEYHIYVVDNASPDGSGHLLFDEFSNVKNITFIQSEKNGGFSFGNNKGIRCALEDGNSQVFILNSDIILLNDAISLMSDKLCKSKDVFAVGPYIEDPDGQYSQSARKPLDFTGYVREGKVFDGNDSYRCLKYNHGADFLFSGMVQGCCFGLKSEYFQDNGLLDENIFMYCEEDIIGHNIRNNGKYTLICADAKVLHKESSSVKRVDGGHQLFYRQHRWPSAVYVIGKYGKTPRFVCIIIMKLRELLWDILSIRQTEYRNKKEMFHKECKSILGVL